MPPAPICRSITKSPSCCPISEVRLAAMSAPFGACGTVSPWSRNSPASPCATNNDSTSAIIAALELHAASTQRVRSQGGTSSAASKTANAVLPLSSDTHVLRPQLAKEPCLSHLPVALHRRRRDLEYLGGFLHRQPAEIPQFHHLSFARINVVETVQR